MKKIGKGNYYSRNLMGKDKDYNCLYCVNK